jgi:hypothetical protein
LSAPESWRATLIRPALQSTSPSSKNGAAASGPGPGSVESLSVRAREALAQAIRRTPSAQERNVLVAGSRLSPRPARTREERGRHGRGWRGGRPGRARVAGGDGSKGPGRPKTSRSGPGWV